MGKLVDWEGDYFERKLGENVSRTCWPFPEWYFLYSVVITAWRCAIRMEYE